MPPEEPNSESDPEPPEPAPDPEPEPASSASPASADDLPAPADAPPAPASPDPLLHPEVLIATLIEKDPHAARVLFEEFDLPCYRCPARYVETLASGISYREIAAEDVLARLRALRDEAAP